VGGTIVGPMPAAVAVARKSRRLSPFVSLTMFRLRWTRLKIPTENFIRDEDEG
jgi:hypothetical protein